MWMFVHPQLLKENIAESFTPPKKYGLLFLKQHIQKKRNYFTPLVTLISQKCTLFIPGFPHIPTIDSKHLLKIAPYCNKKWIQDKKGDVES